MLAVHRGLDHRGLVHVVGGDAFALEWALASQPLRPWAVAAPLLLLLCILFKKCKSRSSWLNCAFEVMKLIIDVTGPVEGIFAFIY